MLLFIAGCAIARANLGDTPAQIESRYGAAQAARNDAASGMVTKFYIRNGMGIAVKFLEFKSQSETYIKGRQAGFSDSEIAALLKENSMGSDWSSVYKTAALERWELKSRDATAVYSHTDHTLIFSTKEFIRSAGRIKLIDSGS